MIQTALYCIIAIGVCVLIFLITGCASIQVKNGDCTASYITVMKNIDNIELAGCGVYGKAGSTKNDPIPVDLIKTLVRP